MNNTVNHPTHYKVGSIECIDAMKDIFGTHNLVTFCKLNAFKYLWRADFKNGLEDIKKAHWYLEKVISLSEESTLI